MDRLAILVPVLNRPHRVGPLLESIAAATAVPHAVYFLPDKGDNRERRALAAADATVLETGRVGYAPKLNEAVRLTDEPLIFLGADDLSFHPNWLETALAKMTDRIGVVGTNDLCNPRTAGDAPDRTHSTHSLVARWYAELGTIDEPDRLLHEGYPHEFVDDELVATARHRSMYAHAAGSVVEHLHPQVGKAPMDNLYAGQRWRMRRGRNLFQARQALWT